VVYAAIDGKAAGILAIADAIRPTSKPAVEELRKLGIQVAMLTGDNRATAERIAKELGMDTVFAEVLPGQKADKVEELQSQGRLVAIPSTGSGQGSATVSTTRRRWPRPTWVSPSAPAPTWPWRRPTWC
jgi:P-type E1-E2 ATPase